MFKHEFAGPVALRQRLQAGQFVSPAPFAKYSLFAAALRAG